METVNFSEWQKIDLRIAKILDVEEVEDADKLYKISINLGKELGERTLVAGLKPHYKIDELKNKQCIVFTNLEPRKIRGIESKGMILAIVSEDEKKVRLLTPDKIIEEGSKIR